MRLRRFSSYTTGVCFRRKLFCDIKNHVLLWLQAAAAPAPPAARRGDLLLSLCYLPTAGRLTVTVIKDRNLTPATGQ
jgi:hypothetical protein